VRLRRSILACVALLVLTGWTPLSSVQQVVLYKDAWTPMQGYPTPKWLPGFHAFTAQTFRMPFDQLKAGNAQVAMATLQVVWQALSPSAYTGVGMFVTPGGNNSESTDLSKVAPWWVFFAANDAGFAPYTLGCDTSSNPAGPHPCWVDVTDAFNRLIAAGVPYFLTIGTYGNGANGPYVYDVELELSWATPPAVTPPSAPAAVRRQR
jgi:hypothetical protein